MEDESGAIDVVIIDYKDIVQDPSSHHSLSPQLDRAFGSTSSTSSSPLGLVVIQNVPGFVEAKKSFLPMAHTLAHLPQDYLEREMTDEASLYNAGWSHGKEKLGDKPDLAKGSFYFNPLTDKPGTEQDRASYPLSYPCNVWPDDERISGFEKKAKHLGTLMKEVVVQLSKHIDSYAQEKVANYPKNALYSAMEQTEKAKGRLLYYFPLDDSAGTEKAEAAEDSWIGWHNDSGLLTALAGDIYVNGETGQVLDESPDPKAGLYVVGRNNKVIQVSIPSDCMAVQIGECVQIMTGGAVVATPHCVRGAQSLNGLSVARISLPCFIDTPPDFPLSMPAGCTRNQVLSAGIGTSRVPPLEARWTENGMTFGDFLQRTFSMYYDWSKVDK